MVNRVLIIMRVLS